MNILNVIQNFFIANITYIDILDILLVAFLFYYFFLIVKGTRALQMLVGVLIIVVAHILSGWMGLQTLNRLLYYILYIIPFAIVIIFQSTIRKVLANLGKNPFKIFLKAPSQEDVIHEVVLATLTLSSEMTGALIVLEKEMGLSTYVDTGIKLDAIVSYDLIINIFAADTPLHDGALIIRDHRASSAGSFLPLSHNPALSQKYGTRHRAAIGITEETDATAVIVSEERGTISLAVDGRIEEDIGAKELETTLIDLLDYGKQEVLTK